MREASSISLRGKRHRKLLVGVAVAAMPLLAAACGSSSSSSSPTSSSPTSKASTGTLTVAETQAPTTLNPQASPLFASRYAWDLAYQCLLTTSPSGKVEPQLATSYSSSSDGLSYTFMLRHGVKFDNGAAFTSADVVYTFKRLLKEGTPAAKTLFPTLKTITASGPYTVTFTLSAPDAGFVGDMANPLVFGCAILSKSAQHLSQKMVGTGPWSQVSYTPNVSLVFKRFASYWGPKTASPRLKILYIPTPSTQVTDLQGGKVSLIFPTAAGATSLKGSSGITVSKVSSDVTVFMDINNAKGPLANVDVRRAIAEDINRQQLASIAYQGLAVPSGYVPPTNKWTTPLSQLPYSSGNVSEARKLLAAGGYPHGFSTSLIYITDYDQGTNSLVQLLATQLGAIGVKVALKPMQAAAWVSANNTNADYGLSWNEQSYYSDPLQYVVVPGYIKPPIPAPLAKDFTAAEDAKSTSAYDAAINVIQKEEADLVYPTVTLLAEDTYVAYGKDVTNVNVGPSLSRDFLANVAVR